jgi:UDP-N-acetylglucosamine--N-acetylmuramyl-(pentapeptide) pyrophosphoryl-undecaprenol N-acetylglucosamine transferase
MSIAIAAAGTGGHVLPAIAVADAIFGRAPIVFFGGDRFEKEAVPRAGFEFVEVGLRGLQRSFSLKNLLIPFTVLRAVQTIAREFRERDVKALLCTGGYVTVPAALAARWVGIPYFIAEQNAHAGLANRLMARKAAQAFTSFAETEGLPSALHVGNPIRSEFAEYSRAQARRASVDYYGMDPHRFTLGVVGGSLGSGALNDASFEAAGEWERTDVQVIHLAGSRYEADMNQRADSVGIRWKVIGFEERMDLFYGAVDLLLSRAGGMVAEITATGTPMILVPGSHGSAGHQAASARILAKAGAAVILPEEGLGEALAEEVLRLMEDGSALAKMAASSRAVAKPDAAETIAKVLLDASR